MTLQDTIRSYIGCYAMALPPETLDDILTALLHQAETEDVQYRERIFWLSEALKAFEEDPCQGCLSPSDFCGPDTARWTLERYGWTEQDGEPPRQGHAAGTGGTSR